MIVIDLRHYEKDNPNKDLLKVVAKDFDAIRGATQEIYDLPDEIWVTYGQKLKYFPEDETIFNISHKYIMPIKIKDPLYDTSN